MSTIKMYKDKLLYIKKDMLDLLDKVGDLKVQKLLLESFSIFNSNLNFRKGLSGYNSKRKMNYLEKLNKLKENRNWY